MTHARSAKRDAAGMVVQLPSMTIAKSPPWSIFTGGIGENSPAIRAEACAGLEAFGIEIDPRRNEATVGSEGTIHRGRTPVHVIPANEELLIAQDTERCLASLVE